MCRNERGLLWVEGEHLVVTGHPRHTTYDDPVLGAVLVRLQRQTRTRINSDSFDLKSIACLDGIVAAPRTVDLAVVF